MRESPLTGSPQPPTHEPDSIPADGSYPQIEVFLTDDKVRECIGVKIHGQVHYLHATSARMLDYRLQGAIDVWNQRLREAKAADPDNRELAGVSEA